jgi:hypothetical protein
MSKGIINTGVYIKGKTLISKCLYLVVKRSRALPNLNRNYIFVTVMAIKNRGQ